MKRQDTSHRAGRRKFFRQAALMGGTAVLTVLGKRARGATSPERPENSRKKGYRLTAHIRKYYEKASF
ncbi:MAG: hypothetical protein PVG35_17040 [Desulfobacterales bacterium]|jgi:hypothetical protein